MDEKIEVTEEVVEDTAAEVTEEAQEKKPAEKRRVKKKSPQVTLKPSRRVNVTFQKLI